MRPGTRRASESGRLSNDDMTTCSLSASRQEHTVVMGEPNAPQDDGCILSISVSWYVYRPREDHDCIVRTSNRRQSVQPLLCIVNERFSRFMRMLLAGIFLHKTELYHCQLMGGLGRHEECWQGVETDASKVAPDIGRITTTTNQPIARDRVDARYRNVQGYFASGPTQQPFQNEHGR